MLDLMSEPSSQSGPQGEAESVEGREDPFTLWTPASITVTCLGVVLEALLILHGLFLLGDGVMAFSMAFLHLPSLPATRPIARARWSPLSIFTSVTMKLSTKRSSTRSNATASATAKPSMYALQKSAAFCKWSISLVCFDVLISTHRLRGFMRPSSLRCSTIGV